MVEQQGWKRWISVVGLLGLGAAAPGCAKAYAQSAPDAGGGGSATGASDASTTATAQDGGSTANAGGDNTSGSAGGASDAGAGGPAPAYTGPEPWFNLRNNPQQLHIGPGIGNPAVVRIVRRNQAAMVDCYKHELATNPRLHGVLSVRLQVIAGGFGTIDRVRFAPRNETMEQCVNRVLRNVTWPNPRGVPAVQVEMEFDLAPTPPPPAPRH